MSANKAKSKGKPIHRFQPGVSGNPAGRPKLPDDVREALKANTLPLLKRGYALLDLLRDQGDVKTEVTLLLGLLRKTVPDASHLMIEGVENGRPVALQVATTEALEALAKELAKSHPR